MKVVDLLAEISVLAAIPAGPPVGRALAWFDGVNFTTGKPSPIDDGMTVIAVFNDDNEIRVYAVPLEGSTSGDQTLKRYRVTKISPTIFVESMPVDTFKACVAQELVDLSLATPAIGLAEDGVTKVLFPPLDREDGDDDDDEEAEKAAAAPASPNGAPATP
jgi:hypothetical protein